MTTPMGRCMGMEEEAVAAVASFRPVGVGGWGESLKDKNDDFIKQHQTECHTHVNFKHSYNDIPYVE